MKIFTLAQCSQLKQTGFTIVEIMIVIAVIGVMSSIAIPLYADYMQRAKVAEAIQLLSGLKIPSQEFYASWGHWPSVESIGGVTSGAYVSLVTADKSGTPGVFYVEATMRGDVSKRGIYGKQIRMLFDGKQDSWHCTTAGATQPIPDQYLPAPCKEN